MKSNQQQNITAIIYDKRGRILSVGRNSYVKTHPLQARAAYAVGESDKKVYQHAEVNALVKLKDWSKAQKMVIQRFTKDGKSALSAPCRCCQWVIEQAGIPEVEYSV